GSLYFTQVANSAISIEKPPSPTNATDWRFGETILAAIAYGNPGAIGARVSERECNWRRFVGILRAHHVALVSESQQIMASSARCCPNCQETTWGFIGFSIRLP